MAIDPEAKLPGAENTSNEEFFDAMIRHQIFLMRLSGSIRNGSVDLLNTTEEELASLVRDSGIDGIEAKDFIALRELEIQVTGLRTPIWAAIALSLGKDMTELVLKEPIFTAGVTQMVTPVVLQLGQPDKSDLINVVRNIPYEGLTLKDWSKKLKNDDLDRIFKAVKIGMVQGESNQQITRRVVGTLSAKGTDGATQLSRNAIATNSRTAVNHISNQSRRLFFQENKDVFSKETWFSTLDGRTSPICQRLDGTMFPVGEGRYPPAHPNCRSIRIASIDGNTLVNRPAKPVVEKQLLREYTNANNLKKVSNRSALPHGTRGGFDAFKRKRVRQLTGTVPGVTTYQKWLTKQSAEFQDDVLGKAKGKLFRSGGFTVTKLVDRQGDPFTLKELARKDRQAFVNAGLDPEGFL